MVIKELRPSIRTLDALNEHFCTIKIGCITPRDGPAGLEARSARSLASAKFFVRVGPV